jgi:tetratricopeptide (TPR) repeat protein
LQSISTMFASADARIEENALSTVLSEVVPSAACLPGKNHVESTDVRQAATEDPLADQLAKARMLLVAGKYDEAVDETLGVIDEATDPSQDAVRADADLLMAEVRTDQRRLDADVYLKEVIRLADKLGNDLLRVRAHLLYATWWANRGEGHFVDANEELKLAEAVLQRMGGNPLLAAQVIMLKGRLASLNGQHEVAEKHYRSALELLRQLLPPEHPLIAKVKVDIALELSRGEAVPMLKEVLGALERLYGSQHPEVASVWHNIGNKCGEAKDWVCALDAYREAIKLREPTRGYDPARLAHTESNLATALVESGSLEEALSTRDLAINDLIEAQADPEEIIQELKLKRDLLQKLGRPKSEQELIEKDIKTRSGSTPKP